jgi:Transposase, Mutator family
MIGPWAWAKSEGPRRPGGESVDRRRPWGGVANADLYCPLAPGVDAIAARASLQAPPTQRGMIGPWSWLPPGIKEPAGAHALEPASLSELIHHHVRAAIERAVHEELRAALGTASYERSEVRRGYRNGTKARMLTGPTGPVALTLPRATLFGGAGAKEWTSAIVPRYQRRMSDVNEAVIATYLAGGNTRRIHGALKPLLKAAPLSRSAVSRVVATLKDGLEAWRTRSLASRWLLPAGAHQKRSPERRVRSIRSRSISCWCANDPSP